MKKVISLCFKEFDTDTIAKRTSDKYKYSHSSPYYKKSADEIKQMWAAKREDSAIKNKKLREDISDTLSGKQIDADETTRLFALFNQVWKISPYRTNWMIFDRMSGIVANVDCLAYMDGKFILYSWVRTDSALEDSLKNQWWKENVVGEKFIVDDDMKESCIKSYYNKGLKGKAFEQLHDCKFTKFNIEQEAIKYILKQNYGITVEDSYIVIMHPIYETPIVFRADSLSKEVSDFMLSLRLENNQKPTLEAEFNETVNSSVEAEETEAIDSIELF